MPENRPTASWLPADFEPGLVSVVIPTFNRAELVCQAVRSVFAQTYPHVEVIVGDDASSDDTLAQLEGLRAACPARFRLEYFGGEKVGACPLRNRGAAMSHGEFLMFLDSDDLLTAPALEQLVKAMQGADIGWGAWRDLREDEQACRLSPPFERRYGSDWLADLLRGEWLATCAVLYRREVLHRVQGWFEPVVLDGDFDFNAQLGAAGATQAGTRAVVSYYRRGGADQISAQDFGKKTAQTRLVLQRCEEALTSRNAWTPARRSGMAARYFHSARMLLYYTGDGDGFEQLVGEALRVDPEFRAPKSWYRWIATMAGYRNAERVAAVGRKLFR
ncbi:MAG: glycosyltransferase family 2 protein [Planctomycetes bacterium]|nr:glycosyltransferase family 2 protein [Planctomycetota bacterium]